MKRATIDFTTKPYTYYDKYGNIIKAGDCVKNSIGQIEKVYLLEDEECLGIDATNKSWIASGKAAPCEYGCYPLTHDDLETYELVTEDEFILQHNNEVKIQLLKDEIREISLNINNYYCEISDLEEKIESLKNYRCKLENELKEIK